MVRANSIPVALTVAGSDSSAGAGIQADLKTFTAFGVYGLTALTCVVAEAPGHVGRIDPVTPEMVRAQIEVLFAHFPIAAVKTGLLCSAEIVRVVAACLREFSAVSDRGSIPLVIDPVMVATSGDVLLREGALAAYEQELFPLAALVTPNLDEAAVLLGEQITGTEQMHVAGEKLVGKYGVSFLLKGGHLTGATATDMLFGRDGEVQHFTAPFHRELKTHGTGCTYSAAITAGLAAGLPLGEAITRGKQFVTRAIERHFAWPNESGPIHALDQR